MKSILITGKDSYIGTSLENWLLREPDKYNIDTLNMEEESWKEHNFSTYNVVFHVAGIAHVRENKKNRELYYKVNRDLAFETAKIAKEAGVHHFIFLSSMSVYGMEEGIITKETQPNPKTAYGRSKLEAEDLIGKLETKDFVVSIIRPPMVYGKGCKGNYARLAKLAKITPIFPKIDNKRSMIYIDNLAEFSKWIVENKKSGTFHPQNKEYVNTSELVKLMVDAQGRKVIFTKKFNIPLNFLLKVMKFKVVRKSFGSLKYSKDITSDIDLVTFFDSIERIEKF